FISRGGDLEGQSLLWRRELEIVGIEARTVRSNDQKLSFSPAECGDTMNVAQNFLVWPGRPIVQSRIAELWTCEQKAAQFEASGSKHAEGCLQQAQYRKSER